MLGKEKRSIIEKIADEFGVFKDYTNRDVSLSFGFSKNNYRESYGKQKRNFITFAKMFSIFDKVIDDAIGIEVHKRSDYKPDPTLENMYVLISAFIDGDFIIPVKLEIKEFNDKKNSLYVAISLEGIKKAEVSKQGTTENGVAQNSHSANISIAELMRNVNPKSTDFTKYFPKEFLTTEQEEELKSKNIFSDRDQTVKTDREILLDALESAPQIKLEKLIGGDIIYVSECVPDGVNKRIYITSAYIKKGSTNQLLNMDSSESPQPTPKASLDGSATSNSIHNKSVSVNKKNSERDQTVKTDREILLDALESAVQNDDERTLLRTYRGQKEHLETAEARVKKLNAEIKDSQKHSKNGGHTVVYPPPFYVRFTANRKFMC